MSEEFKFGVRKVIRVVIGESFFEVRKPTNGDFLQYQKDFKVCADEEAKQECMIAFVAKMGLPRDAFMMLDPDETELLTKALFPQKKTS